MCWMADGQIIDFPITAAQAQSLKIYQCQCCIRGQMKHRNTSKQNDYNISKTPTDLKMLEQRNMVAGAEVGMDTTGKYSNKAKLVFRDKATGFSLSLLIQFAKALGKSKVKQQFEQKSSKLTEQAIKFFAKHQHHIKHLISDSPAEFKTDDIQNLIAKNDMTHTLSTPGQHHMTRKISQILS